jgi:hypothetical protein
MDVDLNRLDAVHAADALRSTMRETGNSVEGLLIQQQVCV